MVYSWPTASEFHAADVNADGNLTKAELLEQLTKSLIEGNQDDKILVKTKEDGGYAGSYAHFSIHHECL